MNATPLAQFLPDAASLINEVVDALRAILRDTSASAETRRRAAATLLHFLVPQPSIRTSHHSAAAKPPPPRGEGRGEGLDQPIAPILDTDSLPLPLGEGRGEGHRSRASSSPRATDSNAAAAEKSMPSTRHEVARDGCQTPHERSSGAGLVTDPSMPPRADGASDAERTHPSDDDEPDDPRLTAALEILRLARPDIDFDGGDDDDEYDDQGIKAVGCPGQRASAPASESAGNHQQFPGAVSERCSATSETSQPIALSPTHTGPAP